MAKLFLKGVQKAIYIEKDTAKNLNRIIDNEAIPDDRPFNMEGVRFSKRDIRYVIENDYDDDRQVEADTRKNENDKYYQDASREHEQYIIQKCKRSTLEKINDTIIFETVYFGMTGQKPTEDEIKIVVLMQEEYFTLYPTHPFARVNFFKLIPQKSYNQNDWDQMKYNVANASIRLYERVMSESFSTAKRLKLVTF